MTTKKVPLQLEVKLQVNECGFKSNIFYSKTYQVDTDKLGPTRKYLREEFHNMFNDFYNKTAKVIDGIGQHYH